MDLEEDWEYLSDDGFVDHLHRPDEKGNGKRLISSDSSCIIDMNYFQKFTDTQKKVKMDPIEAPISPNPVVLELPKPSPTHDWVVKEVISVDAVSPQVSIKEIGENEFADMKLDSPKSTDKGLTPQIEPGSPRIEEKEEEFDGEEKSDKGVFGCNENMSDPDQKERENEKSDGGLNIWKMGMTGMGALCSFGFAFATICVIAIGSRHKEKQQDQKLHLQFYTRDKRMKRVVHHAAKLNEAISAMRGAPLSRAHISIGGYFEGL